MSHGFANVKIIGGVAGGAASATADGVLPDVQVVGPARLIGVSAFNGTAGTLYLQAHDAASEPATGAKPKLVTTMYPMASGGFPEGALFAKGIYLCFSDTALTKTKTAGTPGTIDASYQKL
jgi:hypothetical protein